MPSGTVKIVKRSKGYGFIRPDLGGKDVFVHISMLQVSGLTGDLRKGDRITFEIFDNRGGPAAKNLRLNKNVAGNSEDNLVSGRIGQEPRDHARCEMIWKFKDYNQGKEKRKQIGRAALELKLTEAVRSKDPECGRFVGVIVQRVEPKSPDGVNWSVKGVKYGKTDRTRGGVVLSACVDEAQREFELSD
jgi:cold shock CspA family protein